MIKSSSIEALKAQIDIIQIIGNYITLKKMGINFGCNCPFHDEKTPSFIVSPKKNIYHCYGCGCGGDAITFVMDYEKLSFTEAVEKIADLLNFELEYERGAATNGLKSQQEALESIFNLYQNMLKNNNFALNYLLNRGLNHQSIEKFKLGFCENSSQILKFCSNKNLDLEMLKNIGILGNENGRTYAKFLERIIFPIYGFSNKPIGLGARSLKDGGAKYINSPSSNMFNKSRQLYGYNIAKDFIYSQNCAILCEGYLDVIMLHQAGFNNAVATLGTSATKEHVALLQKASPKIIVAYDGDKAGRNAALKVAIMLRESEGGVALFENNLDPADLVKMGKIDELKNTFDNPTPFVEFELQERVKNFDLENPVQKQKALNECILILKMLSPALQESYCEFSAKLLLVPLDLLKKALKNAQKGQKTNIAELSPKPQVILEKSPLEDVILKNLLIHHEELISLAKIYLHESLFKTKKEAFNAIMEGDLEHRSLSGLILDESLNPESGDFIKDLKIFLTHRLREQRDLIKNYLSISSEERQRLLKRANAQLVDLKNGNLVKIFENEIESEVEDEVIPF
ncbi:MAG: DNA primase [Helicobacter sp.]|nr:DNA primase [Helicobacter sp.]